MRRETIRDTRTLEQRIADITRIRDGYPDGHPQVVYIEAQLERLRARLEPVRA